MVSKSSLRAIATLIGCTIGAGILGIPFVISRSGFLIGMIDIILIGLAILVLNLYVGEITLRTKGNHQLPGYAKRYLGKAGKRILMLTMVFASYGALVAYMIGSGKALSSIFSFFNPFYFSLIYLIIMSIFIYFGLRAIGNSELILGMIMMAIAVVIIGFSISSSSFQVNNLAYSDITKAILPYGVILFAFLGSVAVPEMKEILTKERKCLKKSIIAGTLASLVIYVLFALAVVGVTGINTTDVATLGLGNVLGLKMILFGNIFALFTMSTSFLVLGLALKEMFHFDYNLKKNLAWVITCTVPLILFLAGVKNFIVTLAVVGAVAGGIQSILIILMHRNARKYGNRKPEFSFKNFLPLNITLILLFVFGIIFEILRTAGIIRF